MLNQSFPGCAWKTKYPGIVTAVEVAMNADGERFILATKKDGEPLKGVKMICKLDEHKTRWVHDIVVLRLFEIAASSTSK